jgi:hypothetical protein
MTRKQELIRLKNDLCDKPDMMLGDFLQYDFGDLDQTACAINALYANSKGMALILIDALIAQEVEA